MAPPQHCLKMGVSHNLYPVSVSPSMVEGLPGRRQLTQFTSSLREGRHVRHILCRAEHITHYTHVRRTASQRGLGAGDGFSCEGLAVHSSQVTPGCAPRASQSCWGIEMTLNQSTAQMQLTKKGTEKKNAGTLPALPGEFGLCLSEPAGTVSVAAVLSWAPFSFITGGQPRDGAGRSPRPSLHLSLPPRRASCAKVMRGRTLTPLHLL